MEGLIPIWHAHTPRRFDPGSRKRAGRLLAAIASLALTAALLAGGAQPAAAAPAKAAPKRYGACTATALGSGSGSGPTARHGPAPR
ncbi:hypothetical protein [Streptomyces hiroshimensis]